MRKSNFQFIKYIFFGGLNTLITFGLYVLLIKIEVNYIFASSICYLIGIIEGYILNACFVFASKIKFSGLSKYSLVYVVSYFINILILLCFVSILGEDKILSQAIATVIVTLLNFKLVKWLVFNRRS